MSNPVDPGAYSRSQSALRPLAIDVISVQSQVVYGRVGNNVAVPALQAQGLTVATVPTVMFSNTPHYSTFHGGAIPAEWFGGYLSDLFARDALSALQAVITGYMGDPQQIRLLADWIVKVIALRPTLQVVMDPVLGDHDTGQYVSPDMAQAYQRYLLPLANGLTPNGFELQQLTGLSATDIDSVVSAARHLLVGRTQWVVVTSAAPAEWPDNQMLVAVVTRDEQKILSHARIDATPKGTGDLFGATLTGRLLAGASIFEAASYACDQLISALQLTYQMQSAELLLPPDMGSG
ncbi:bifunctional pyridoxal kinase/hydroxymethylpyrimidine kinase [Advenella sp. S44]|uniref:pyridoxine/pyridoxal/pyridoxamine kinase n=1 Tax=Advenella sp. S44 TaxID=1982755 RepID=UPI000C2AEB74|nr:pyridoxine/pyridoxal/pyridoxamine kinase [Advenella sp. S44]PJX28295.1 bifunctional pyridoxal kinase/hydroxymethylpyrimidine kinase [Advenella sp. S44]